MSEVMVAMTILLIAMSITMGAYLVALKRGVHTQNTLQATGQLRYATDLISESVRSSPQEPAVQSSGRQLLVAPKDLGFGSVYPVTWIDTIRNVKGSKGNQRVLKLKDFVPAAVSRNIFKGSARPTGAVSSSSISTYFNDASSLPAIDLDELFAVGDSLTIPATAYGPAFTKQINSISNNSGTKTLTMTDNLGFDVPEGTKITATSGRRLMFSVETNGDLRFYRDHRDTTKFVLLARDVDYQPYSVPWDQTSARTTPFAISGRVVTINFQHLPKGGMAGRTVQGVQTQVYARTDPLIQ